VTDATVSLPSPTIEVSGYTPAVSSADIQAIETIATNCYRSFAGFPNAETIDNDEIFAVLSYMPIPFFSGVARTNLDANVVGATLDLLRSKNCPLRWWVTPSTRPDGLAETLRARGLRHAYDAPGMIADLTALPLDAPLPQGIKMRQLTRADELVDWLAVFTVVFSSPEHERGVWRDAYARLGVGVNKPWQHFVAFEGDRPLATTSVHVVGDLAGIYFVATMPEARGRGIGSAATRAAMRYARDAGARRAALQSSDSGFGVYRALGFEQRCVVSAYEWRPQLASPQP
jgi:ribosomal protein S18 acetylase RimI-like enzyme